MRTRKGLNAMGRTLGALLVASAFFGMATPTFAGGGAFVGGLVAGHVVTNAAARSERRTQAAEYEAYHQDSYSQGSSSSSGGKTVEQRLDDLDRLAADGYISKEEYQRRRQAIINSL